VPDELATLPSDGELPGRFLAGQAPPGSHRNDKRPGSGRGSPLNISSSTNCWSVSRTSSIVGSGRSPLARDRTTLAAALTPTSNFAGRDVERLPDHYGAYRSVRPGGPDPQGSGPATRHPEGSVASRLARAAAMLAKAARPRGRVLGAGRFARCWRRVRALPACSGGVYDQGRGL